MDSVSTDHSLEMASISFCKYIYMVHEVSIQICKPVRNFVFVTISLISSRPKAALLMPAALKLRGVQSHGPI